jgi:hypothetical protein
VILYTGLGYSGSIPLLLSAAYVTAAAIGNYICSLVIDRVGRVRLFSEWNVFSRVSFILTAPPSHWLDWLLGLSLLRVSVGRGV